MARTQHEPFPKELVIEVDQERKVAPLDNNGNEVPDTEPMVVGNNNVYFFPIDTSLRSRFVPWRSGPAYPPVLNQLQDVPGQRIHFDPDRKCGWITDGLGEAKHESTLRKINAVNAKLEPPRSPSGPHKIQEHLLRTEAEKNTWLYWMARAVEDGNAKVVQGKLEKPEFYLKGGDVPLPEYHNLPNQPRQFYKPETVGAA